MGEGRQKWLLVFEAKRRTVARYSTTGDNVADSQAMCLVRAVRTERLAVVFRRWQAVVEKGLCGFDACHGAKKWWTARCLIIRPARNE